MTPLSDAMAHLVTVLDEAARIEGVTDAPLTPPTAGRGVRSDLAGLAARDQMAYGDDDEPEAGTCVECGNDDAAEGLTWCSDCLYNSQTAPELRPPGEFQTAPGCLACEELAAVLGLANVERHRAEAAKVSAEYEADVQREAAFTARAERADAWERGWLAAMRANGLAPNAPTVMPPNPYARGGH
jgi:hypothetical protein